MRHLIFCLSLVFFGSNLFAQDVYHTGLLSNLMSSYNLPAGNFILANTEEDFLAAAYSWGSSRIDLTVPGNDFSRTSVITVSTAGNNPWDSGFFVRNSQAVNAGDVVLYIFNARTTSGAPGNVSLVIEEVLSGNYSKEVFSPLEIGAEWQTYFAAFETSLGNHPAEGLQFGFHLANAVQTIEFGGIAAINFGDQVSIDDLPNTFDPNNYGGSAADAPWRATAAERIENIRKADINISTISSNGEPVPGVALDINMMRHEFAFGTAIKGCRFPGNNCDNATFRENLLNLDGNGHGFNWVVYENDLKWDAWEENWFGTNEEVASSVQYLADRDIKVRGHVLVWPGWNNLPDDMQANANNEPYLMNRTLEHLETILDYPGIDGNIADWDVINETVVNTDLAAAIAGEPGYTTGREFYQEIFDAASQHAPEAKLYLNDFSTITLSQRANDPAYETKRAHLEELVAAGAAIDGIGFQCHVGAVPNSIPTVIETFDDFYDQFGLEQKVTEFDMPPNVSEELGANYMIDFMTATFSHPSMNGFFFWNFWDVDTWQNPGSNLFDANWNRTPAGDAYVETVFGDWWTNESTESDVEGNAQMRGFKGDYVLTYVCGGETIRDTFTLSEGGIDLELSCDEFLLDVNDQDLSRFFTVAPNPTNGNLRIEHPLGPRTKARMINSFGQTVWQGQLPNQVSQLSLLLPAGSYVLQLFAGEQSIQRKVIIW